MKNQRIEGERIKYDCMNQTRKKYNNKYNVEENNVRDEKIETNNEMR